MATKYDALEQIIAIARAHKLTISDITSALEPTDSEDKERSKKLLERILAFLGGTFVIAGLGVFVSLNWDIMNTAARIIITLGSGIAVFIIAIVVSNEKRYEKASIPLYLIASALQPTGILVTIDEFSTSGDWRHAALLTAGVMAFQQGAVFWKKKDATLLFTTLIFVLWFFGVALDLLYVSEELIGMVLGASTVSLCVGLERTKYRGVTPFWYLVGSIFFFYGLFDLVQHTFFELAVLAAACGGVFLSTYVRSRTLLFTSTVAILAYISYFTEEHFLNSLSWPLALVFIGLALIALSAFAMRINRRYISNS